MHAALAESIGPAETVVRLAPSFITDVVTHESYIGGLIQIGGEMMRVERVIGPGTIVVTRGMRVDGFDINTAIATSHQA